MSVVPLTTQQWRDLNQNLNNFFAGVGIMNRRIIDDSIILVNKFIASLTIPTTPKPIIPKPPIVTKPTPPQQKTNLTPTFVSSLTRSDLEKGGWRTRATRQGLIKWTGTHRVSYSGRVIRVAQYKSNGWVAIRQQAAQTKTVADKLVNDLKASVGSSYVLTFGTVYFLISDGHVQGFK